jgi:hypothetical protein
MQNDFIFEQFYECISAAPNLEGVIPSTFERMCAVNLAAGLVYALTISRRIQMIICLLQFHI